MSTGQMNQKMTLMLPLLNREHRVKTNGCSGKRGHLVFRAGDPEEMGRGSEKLEQEIQTEQQR